VIGVLSAPDHRKVVEEFFELFKTPWEFYRRGPAYDVVIATTDPLTLPDLTTFYLVTNLPAPGSQRAQTSELAAASLEEVVHLYGLRMWVEQSYKQVKHALGWSQYQAIALYSSA